MAKLSEQQVADIRRRWTGVRGQQTMLAGEFGVSRTQIRRIVLGQSWSAVDKERVA